MSDHDILERLGRGESISSLCAAAGLSRQEFDAWWTEQCRRRVPAAATTTLGTEGQIRVERDAWGVAHVCAGNDADAFFGFGYATAQDRLFQLDFLRRRARGRLAEILGPEGVSSDILYRTLGLGQIADREWTTLPVAIQNLLAAYTAGINSWVDESRGCPPIEFDLLGYRPEPWQPADSLAIIGEFRWYLTGRFPVIVIPELAKRTLGEDALYRAFLQGEEDAESILRPGEYDAGRRGVEPIGHGSTSEGSGSNNWVLAGSRTASGKPLVANDPHIPFGAVSIWHEIHIHSPEFQVAGAALAGMPAIMIGRSPQMAWGITNNICSQRDLYQEKMDPAHPGCFLYDGRWEPAKEQEEVIHVRGAAPVRKVIRSSRHGPIVDEVLPPAAKGTGPVSLRWLGFEPCGWLTALLGMNRARNCAEFREASRPWLVPTFNVVFADIDGHIGFQSVGRIPLRTAEERGYRPGWEARHAWAGLIPFEAMPHLVDPERGFIVTANNRLAPDDYPYLLAGRWSSGYRARRIRELIEAKRPMTREDCQAFQLDNYSGRAGRCVPHLVRELAGSADGRVAEAVPYLADWDCRIQATSVAAALFNVFFVQWCRAVASARFPRELAAFVAANAGGLAVSLLEEDKSGWFADGKRSEAIRAALRRALDELTERLGTDMSRWQWGRLHILVQKHFLSGRGDLGHLLDLSGQALGGDATTVNSSTPDPDHAAPIGAGYRMVADLADTNLGLWAVEVAGASGQPGSRHYDDQIEPWCAGEYHYVGLSS
jgi:penicillin amidase